MLINFMKNKVFMIFMSGALFFNPVLSFGGNRISFTPFEKTVTKTFTVNAGASLSISNKYGKVNFHTWNKDQIQAVITIKANGSSTEEAQQVVNNVSIQSSQSGNHVDITTQYGSNSGSSFWKKFFGGGLGNSHRSVLINYEVYLPQSLADLQVQNSYGDVAGDNLPGNVSVKINYGHFHLNNLAKSVKIDANYGSGTISSVSNLRIHANYTDFNLDKIDNLFISSNYSDYKIGQAKNIRVEQDNYGDINATSVSEINSSTTYSDYKIGMFSKGGSIHTTYGDVHIKSLGDQFSGLVIEPTYSDVYIGLPQSTPVKLDINLVHGDLHAKSVSMNVMQKTEDHGRTVLKAVTTGGGEGSPALQISGTYADVSLSGK